MRRYLLSALPLIAVLATSAHAQQQTNSSTTFDNWVMNCSTQTDKDNKISKACEVRSTLILQDQQSRQQMLAAIVAIGRSMSEKNLRSAIQVPISAQLNVPVKLTGADEKPILELGYTACQQQLCTAAGALTDTQVTALKKAGEKFFLIYKNQAGQEVKLESSTKGLTQALDALSNEK